MTAGRRILIVNPNTSPEVTNTFAEAARFLAPADVAFDSVTGNFGARIVMTEAENVVAGHSALDLVARHFDDHDAIILAISFDTALSALSALVPVPVIGITEAALRVAAKGGRKVGVVLFGHVSQPLYEKVVRSHGYQPVAFEAVTIASTQDYLTPHANDEAIIAACRHLQGAGADAIVICGAAIVGTASRLQSAVTIPLYDGTEAVDRALSEVENDAKQELRAPPSPGGETVGLSAELAAFLRGDRHER